MFNLSNFSALGINSKLINILKNTGIVRPTPIQEKTIPILLAKKDVIAQAQTGTGKTLAFVLPILEMLDPKEQHIQALIITPTRELAIQITSEIKKIVEHLENIHVLPVYGGQDVERQMRKLKSGNQIVVGTPGRILDHMSRGTINLSKVSFLVLDEADQMLHMGFLPDVQQIIETIPYRKQTVLTSATMPEQIRSLARQYMKKPEEIQVKAAQITVKDTKQLVIETTDRKKQGTLFQLIDQHRPYLAIIFCRTKIRASKLNTELLLHGYDSDELHGDLSQAKREDVMNRFRQAKIQLLVATDVAARGLDIEGVTHVYNYDIPHDTESYIHRIGRTGRAGEKGIAITLFTPKDQKYLDLIEKGLKTKLEKRKAEEGKIVKENTLDSKGKEKTFKDKDNRNKENRKPKEGYKDRKKSTDERNPKGKSRTSTSKGQYNKGKGATNSRGTEAGRGKVKDNNKSKGNEFGRGKTKGTSRGKGETVGRTRRSR